MRRDIGDPNPYNSELAERMALAQDASMQEQMTMVAEYHPLQVVTVGTEALKHLGRQFERFYVDTRDNYIQDRRNDPAVRRTLSLVVWGRTLSNKRTVIGQIQRLVEGDPVFQRDLGRAPDMNYISFASSANLAKAEGRIPADEGHGTYSDRSYRAASKVMWRLAAEGLNNYGEPDGGPQWDLIEATGPAAYLNDEGKIVGPDRGFSVVHQLRLRAPEQTRVLVLKRGEGVLEKGLEFRKTVEDSDPEKLPAIFEKFRTRLIVGNEPLDATKLTAERLVQLKAELMSSMAPYKGVIRSNEETDRLMMHMGITDEDRFWDRLVGSELGYPSASYEIVENPFTDEVFSLHHDSLDKIDLAKKLLAERQPKSLVKTGSTREEVTFSQVVGTAVDWVKRDFRRLRGE